jgi:uncharacterized membrane protein
MAGRTHNVSRLEGFSDAVFGFALTLLVVTLEAPRSAGELDQLLRGSLPFALMFAMICYIWWEHNKFFRRYGLEDAWTVFLNAVLLFVVLFYVYPLKFLTTSLIGPWFGVNDVPDLSEGRFVILLFSVGVVLMFGTFVMLYQHAWRRRDALGLSTRDVVALRFGRRAHLITVGLGLVSIALALVSGDGPLVAAAGLVYCLMGPFHGWNGYRAGRAIAAAEAPIVADEGA